MEIKPYKKNAKEHDIKQIELIANSLKRFGWRQNIIVNKEGVIIAGHGRYIAYQKYPEDIKEPWIVDESGKTISGNAETTPFKNEDEEKAYRLADNQINALTGFKMDLVIEELKGLSDELIDLTGFDKDLIIEPDEQDDVVPDVPEEPQSKLGDLYELGNHRVLCGDSTKLEDVERLMDGKKAELLFTSPPYSDMREYNGGKDLSTDNLAKFIETYEPYCQYQAVNLGIQRKNNDIFEYWNDYILVARNCGYKMLAWNVWVKQNAGGIGNQSAFIPIMHEWIFVFGKEFKDINRIEKRKTEPNAKRDTRRVRQADGTMEVSGVGSQEWMKEMESVFIQNSELGSIRGLHPATFPIALPDKYVRSITNVGNITVDPFLGSGSTLIASEKTGRICYGMELDPRYTDVIVQRYVDYVENPKIIKNGIDETHLWTKTQK